MPPPVAEHPAEPRGFPGPPADGAGPQEGAADGGRRPAEAPEGVAGRPRYRRRDRAIALFEVLLCSDYPTQLGIAVVLDRLGLLPYTTSGRLSLRYVFTLSVVDAAVLIGLILLLLRLHGERPGRVLLGTRPVGREALLGLPIAAVSLALGVSLLLVIQRLAPQLHNVKSNPLEGLIRTPLDAWIFALVTLVAGGFREEIQRAFILTRFERGLGGPVVGLILSSIAFGAGHFLQGWDAVLTTALLGAFWGAVYLRRRSIAAPVVSHAGFDLIEIAQYALLHH